MIKVMFVCLGNICRSPMAEFVFKSIVKNQDYADKFEISSSATSREEEGNGMHTGTRRKLEQLGIPYTIHRATQFTVQDYKHYDYILVMESRNIGGLLRIIGNDNADKIHKLLDFASGGDIADPWYTGNFDDTYRDVVAGCNGFLEYLKKQEKI